MQPTSSSKCSTVLSLLQQGYYLHQIQSKTGLGKSTIGRTKKEVDGDKENSKGGCPARPSSGDKQSIIHQITSGRLWRPPISSTESFLILNTSGWI